jgi:hypothetical protein
MLNRFVERAGGTRQMEDLSGEAGTVAVRAHRRSESYHCLVNKRRLKPRRAKPMGLRTASTVRR